MPKPLVRVLRKLRRAFDALLPPEPGPPNYTGPHGCLRAGASFIAWNQVFGDYLEFGVASGESFIAAWNAISEQRALVKDEGYDTPAFGEWAGYQPRMLAFDSFTGLPDGPGERMADYHPGAYQCSEPEFRKAIEDAGVPSHVVSTVPGFYDATLTPETKQQIGLSRAAMIMIDCDLYESTVPVLEFITDLVQQGTIIVFHDWFRFKGDPNCGEQKACREWLDQHPEIELIEFWREAPQAVSFVVNMR